MKTASYFLALAGLTWLVIGLAPEVLAQDTAPAIQEEVELKVAPETQALGSIEKTLNELQSMQAQFRMVPPEGKPLTGTLSMKKPGFIRFDFGESANQLYVSNGKTLSVIDYEIGKVERVPVKDTPLSLLLSEKFSLKNYRSRVITNPDSRADLGLMVEDPKRPEMGILTVYFRFKQKETPQIDHSLLVDYWTIVDGQGRLTYVILENQQMNVTLSDKLWNFKDPRGRARRRN
ncbi:outer membrane lipoprotein carrier protein LolA [Temperatibacter marinus]|uniref:Outer membrane lipoprotein carrier protein LolA n=1 Tax=Temperatibacter marinus TaxID=1456591 RepID=A0AA52EJX9_9PROT|nr:outer membrane lipoprotein carrier protein LolA [Temperatibacter marinus]WND03629.1 outer membrane lipoprotein carrier protein LolA [Temperatibacter marinus]